jgi:hypothetical protein
VVKGAAKLGELVSRKVGEWLVMNQLYKVRLTLFEQKITATPYSNWVCEDGKWKCEKVWQYSVGQLRRKSSVEHGPFRLESKIARHRMESTISRLGRVAQREIAKSLQARADFDAKHQPGPCQ